MPTAPWSRWWIIYYLYFFNKNVQLINDFSNKTEARNCSPAGPFCSRQRISFIILWLWVRFSLLAKILFSFLTLTIQKRKYLIFDKFLFVPAIIVHNKSLKSSIFLFSAQFCNIKVREILFGYLSRRQLLAVWWRKFWRSVDHSF